MSVFIKSLKTFRSDITGEEKEYRINNAIFAYLKADHNMSENDLNGEAVTNEDICKFIHSVFKANGIETSLEDILENTAGYDAFEFMNNFNMVNNENFTLVTQRLVEKTAVKKKIHNKKV